MDKNKVDIQFKNSIQEDKLFWSKQFSKEFQKTTFAGSNLKLSNGTSEFKDYHFSFSEKLYNSLTKITGSSDQKLHIVLMSALVSLLYKYLLNDNIIIGTPIDRQDSDADFINTEIMLNHNCNNKITFKEIIMQTRDLLLDAIDHQNYPINAIIKDCGYDSNESYNPFTDITLLLEKIHDFTYVSKNMNNIIFSFNNSNNKVDCSISYNSYKYSEEFIIKICDKYSCLLMEMLKDVNKEIVEIDLLNEEEIEKYKSINDTYMSLPDVNNIYELIKLHFTNNPNKVAIEYNNQEITYLELSEKVDDLVCLLLQKGIHKGDIVGLYLNNSAETIVSILSVLKCGAVYLPIDISIPEERIGYIIKDSNTKYVITDKESIGNVRFEVPIIDISLNNTPNEHTDCNKTDELWFIKDPAYVIYTSGSTGNPKGVVVTHESLLNYIIWASKTYIDQEGLSFPLFSSISFDLTITSIFTPLITGNKIVVYRQIENENIIERIVKDNKVDIIKLTPSHLKLAQNSNLLQWINENRINIKLKKMIVGGEDLPVQLTSAIHKMFNENISIYNEYGPTEATVGCIVYKYEKGIEGLASVPIGEPIDNMQVYILDKNDQLVCPGKVGEIHLSGTGLAKEYLNKTQLTKEKFVILPHISNSRLYRTGDLGIWDGANNIVFLGRKDNQVKINGFRVELEEIDNKIKNIAGINDAITIIDKSEYGDSLISYYVSENEFDPEIIKENLSGLLPEYMIPNFFQQINSIPLTRNGKLDKSSLPKPNISSSVEYVAPSNIIEEKLVGIWSEVLELDVEKISVNATFIDLGGHSLKAVFLISRIEKELGVEFTLNQLFHYETIRKISQVISISENNFNSDAVYNDINKIII